MGNLYSMDELELMFGMAAIEIRAVLKFFGVASIEVFDADKGKNIKKYDERVEVILTHRGTLK